MAKLSYKVSYYVLYAMFAIILVVLGLFYFGGDAQGDAVLMSVDSEMWQPAHTDALIYLMYILFFVAIIATVVGVLFQFGAALKDNPGAALKSLIGLGKILHFLMKMKKKSRVLYMLMRWLCVSGHYSMHCMLGCLVQGAWWRV